MFDKKIVYFVGAGPGDVKLITVKGKELLENADVVIYAGSLVNSELLAYCKKGCEIYDSKYMNLEEIVNVMEKAVNENKLVVRLHTGDPSLYGAIFEQFVELDKRGVSYEVVPGVSSAFAACTAIKREFTVPEISQTVIFTRFSGRTKVPEKENLENIAKLRASLAIFLSISYIDELVKALLKGYSPETPCSVVYKASWKDEKIIKGTLENITDLIKTAGIRKTALILVGDFIEPKTYAYSRLYEKDFEHEFRKK